MRISGVHTGRQEQNLESRNCAGCRILRSPLLPTNLLQVEICRRARGGLDFGLDQRLERKEKKFFLKNPVNLRGGIARITASLLWEGGKRSRGNIVALSLTFTKNIPGS